MFAFVDFSNYVTDELTFNINEIPENCFEGSTWSN